MCAALGATGEEEEGPAQTAEAAARILRTHRFFSERLGQALVAAAGRGSGGPEVYRALDDLASSSHRLRFEERKPLRELPPEIEERLSEGLLAPLAGLRVSRWTDREREGPQPVSLAAADLPLRRLLLAEPDLAGFVSGDLSWLRLIVALFGGLGNFRVPELQCEVVRRTRELEAGGPDPETYRPLAVRLDTDFKPRLSLLSKVVPRFAVEHVFFPSLLAEPVLEGLRRRAPAQDLVERLRAIWRGTPASARATGAASVLADLWESYLGPSDSPEPSALPSGGEETAGPAALRAEALIALAALGVEVETELARAAADPQQRPVLKALRSRLDDLATSLEDPVARIGEGLLLDLLVPAGTVDGKLWQEVAARAFELVATSGVTVNPISLLKKMTLPDEARAQVLSETWSVLFSGSISDWKYSLAVSLDTLGHTLSQSFVDAMVRARQASNRLWPHHLGWLDEDLDPVPSTLRDAVLDALEAIDQIPPGAPYVQSWALGRLAPHLLEEHPELLPEVLLVVLTLLQDDPVCLDDALEDLAPELKTVPPAERVADLLDRTRALKSPYLRFRALLRFLWVAPERLLELLPEILAVARQEMPSAREEIHVLERLLLLAPPGAEQPLIERILTRATALEDFEERSLILARSALRYLFGEGRQRLLRKALHSVAEIPNPERRGETLRRLARAVDSEAEAGREWRRQVEGLPVLAKARALGLAAPALAAFEPSVRLDSEERIAAWGALSLLARVRDLRRLLDLAGEELGSLWGRVAEGDEEAFRELTERGATAAIAWDPAAVGSLQSLLEQGREEQVAEILILLEPPPRSLLPVLRRWRSLPRLTWIVDLLGTETDGLTSETLSSLVQLLQDHDDRLRMRASLALYQPARGELRRASRLGQATVEALMRYRLELMPTLPRISLVFAWALEKVLFDSPEMLRSWARIAEEGASFERDCDPVIARSLLGYLWLANESAWEALLEQLENRGPIVQRELLLTVVKSTIQRWSLPGQGLSDQQDLVLRDLLRRVAAGSLDEEVRVRAVEALGWVGRDAKEVAALRGWADGDAAMAAAALVALGRIGVQDATRKEVLRQHLIDPRPDVAVAAAEGLLRAGVTAKELLAWTGDERLVLEGLIYACSYHFIGPDFRRAVQNAATFLVESADRRTVRGGEDLFAAVVRRLDAVLAGEESWIRDAEEVYRLLPVVAAAAERMPATFSALGGQLGRSFVQRLQNAALLVSSFPCREAAIVLLSLLRDLDASILPALRATLYDVPYVRSAALRSVERLRDIRLEALDELLARLVEDPSPLGRYAVSRVLTTMARNPRLEPAVRRPVRNKVQKALAQALRDPRSQRHVYLLEQSDSLAFRIRHLGRLDHLFHQALLELSVLDVQGRSQRPRQENGGESLVWLNAPVTGKESGRMEIVLDERGTKGALIEHQLSWYRNQGDTPPSNLLESMTQLQEIAESSRLAFGDLVRLAIERARRQSVSAAAKEDL
ncbi:MAG TPA: hypothetical protein VLQ45_18835 [Thermoanaerobaculia bacterium]|nr:hypothetical protein [Thermoanaerobaculia bacterium]